MNQVASVRMDATILVGMDWVRVRSALQEAREAAKLNQVALARMIGVNKSTINRIENVYGEPDHKPDLATLVAWLQACDRTVSGFFAEIEQTGNPSLQIEETPLHNSSGVVSSISNGRANIFRAEPAESSESRDVVAVPTLRPVPPDLTHVPQKITDALGHFGQALGDVATQLAALSFALIAASAGEQTRKSRPPVSKIRHTKPRGRRRHA